MSKQWMLINKFDISFARVGLSYFGKYTTCEKNLRNNKKYINNIKKIKFIKNHGDYVIKDMIISEITYFNDNRKYLFKSPVNGTIIHKNYDLYYNCDIINNNIYNDKYSWLYDIKV